MKNPSAVPAATREHSPGDRDRNVGVALPEREAVCRGPTWTYPPGPPNGGGGSRDSPLPSDGIALDLLGSRLERVVDLAPELLPHDDVDRHRREHDGERHRAAAAASVSRARKLMAPASA